MMSKTVPKGVSTTAKNDWYRNMVVYQIWPRSFCDGNGDGIGDLWGVFSKLDYIKSLGADAIWFSPLYPSPNADFGYDISDYKNINPEYGDLEIFKKVLQGAHERGMRVIMDLVVNHTSDEHEWFKKSRDKESPYRDYYFWRPGKTGRRGKKLPPNNWDSLFEGGAWVYDGASDEYYLHIFAEKQPDLNHDNPVLREEVKSVMRFWLSLGVDGFREDAITFISKTESLPSAFPKLPAGTGMSYYVNGPHIHEYLREYRAVAEEYDAMLLGEGPRMEPEAALAYLESGELDLMFNFSHMEADCLVTDFIQRPFDLLKLKTAFSKWQKKLNGRAWNTLYIENHDHPRVISRYGSEKLRTESGKMLAAAYMLQQGTPFVYQGQEIGMTNIRLPRLDMYVDVMLKNNVRIASKILPKSKVLELAQKSCRDSARTPMQWTAGKNAGFSEVRPWFYVNDNYREINVTAQEEDSDSLLNFYRRLIKFKKEDPRAIWGDYSEHLHADKDFYVYSREYKDRRLLVICSFSKEPQYFAAPEGFNLLSGTLLFKNYDMNVIVNNGFTARPFEVRVYSFE
ncbi:MAG: alpha-glucosidase [Clostridia bacterium]|nr:alpha-glucosidase [Clostridia bacterium]